MYISVCVYFSLSPLNEVFQVIHIVSTETHPQLGLTKDIANVN